VEEEEEEEGNLLSKGPSNVYREMDEIDEVLQARYLEFLEQEFETNLLQVNDTMNETEKSEILLMREYNDLLNKRVELLVHSLKAK
jgi:hypothetical protein